MEERHAVTSVAVGVPMLLVALLLGACGPSKRPLTSGSATRTEILYSCADAECIVGTDGLNPVVLPFPARTSTPSGSATTLSTGVCSVSPGGAVAACPQATDHLVGDGGNYSDLRLIVVHTDGTHRHTIWSPPPGSYDPSDRFDILTGTPAWNPAGTRLAIVVPETTPTTCRTDSG